MFAAGLQPGCGEAGDDTTYPQGEVGILKDVMLSTIAPHSTCFLIMEHCGAQYIGALLVSDPAFHREICKVLFQNCGETILDIGEIDISLYLLNIPAQQKLRNLRWAVLRGRALPERQSFIGFAMVHRELRPSRSPDVARRDYRLDGCCGGRRGQTAATNWRGKKVI